MKLKELTTILFTEYPGHLGYAPAVLTIVFCAVVAAGVGFGALSVTKAVFSHSPIETGHS